MAPHSGGSPVGTLTREDPHRRWPLLAHPPALQAGGSACSYLDVSEDGISCLVPSPMS